MKKVSKLLLVAILFFALSINGVWAADEDEKEAPKELQELSLDEKDYEISCTYSDGATLVISRNDVVLSNLSSSTSSSSTSNTGFYYLDGQNNIKTDAVTTQYNHANILENGYCPKELFVYKITGKNLRKKVSKGSDDAKNNYTNFPIVDEDNKDLDKIDFYYYATKTGLASEIAGGTAKEQKDMATELVSEQAFLLTSKYIQMCDYETKVEDESLGEPSSAIIYLSKNMSFLSMGGYMTPLSVTLTECPLKNKNNPIYINDPTQKTVGNGNLVASSNYYNYIRFAWSDLQKDCQRMNDGESCNAYYYKGTRDADGLINENAESVCQVIGNELVKQIQTIAVILQILVPTLVIILTGIDIGRLVLTSNLEEVLPKKKKTIIIRFVVLIIFLFAPVFTKLIITLLNNTGVVHIGDVSCLFK